MTAATTESASAPPHTRKPALQRMLSPKVVSLIGATETEGSAGKTLTENLRTFGPNFYPINPNRETALGSKAFRNIADVPVPVDLAVIATPAATDQIVVNRKLEKGRFDELEN
jgi:acetyltransferase